ncbi:hypothetical protein VTJ04DRAFT_5624 [Mycothermus thermophilus]|uniref:uncharacterized protein n=1 Tax=Humicola insolens TaxID=85995 RepID=UPI00374481F6
MASPTTTAPQPVDTALPSEARTRRLITSFPYKPLTTYHRRPWDCTGIYMEENPPLLVIDNKSSCLPDNFAGSTDDSRSFFFSPGYQCPEGYWTACRRTASSLTTITCCPILNTDIALTCQPDPMLMGGILASYFCTWQAPAFGTPVTITHSDTLGKTSTFTKHIGSTEGLNAYGVRMVYRIEEVPKRLSTAVSTAAMPTATPTMTTTGMETSIDNNDADNGDAASSLSTGLSTGMKIAIGVSTSLCVLTVILVGFFLWRWRRQKQREQLTSTAPNTPGPSAAELPENPATYYYYYYYLGPAELKPPQELPSTREAAELPN